MGEAVLISICIPAYNRVNYLRRLLDSICIQSFRHFEVVVTDDSPGNDVYDLVCGHPAGPLIRYFKNGSPLGTPENWNESIRRAKGEWIKLMHDDDWFAHAESLAGFVHRIQSGQAGFYFSAYENVFPDGVGKAVAASSGFVRRLNRNSGILLAANRIGPPSAVLFKNDPALIFDNRLQWLVDVDFYMHYLQAHPPAVYIPQPLVCIGISASQVTQTSFGNRKVEIPERFRLWEKMPAGSAGNLVIYDSWWRFLRNLGIKEPDEIRAAGYAGPIPSFVQSMMAWQKHIPRVLLDRGILSKMMMGAHYLIRFLFSGSTGIVVYLS